MKGPINDFTLEWRASARTRGKVRQSHFFRFRRKIELRTDAIIPYTTGVFNYHAGARAPRPWPRVFCLPYSSAAGSLPSSPSVDSNPDWRAWKTSSSSAS
jgi:hypothetical protein